MGGEEGEEEMNRGSDMEIRNTRYGLDRQWEFDVWLRELDLGLCHRREGGDMGVPEADPCSCVTEKHKTFTSPIRIPFISLSSLIVIARTYKTM